MDSKKIFGFVGSIMLFVGVFSPVINAPIVGSINSFQNGRGLGVVFFVLAIISFFLTIMKLYKWLGASGLISLGITVYIFIAVQSITADQIHGLSAELEDNPFKDMGSMAIQSIQLQWGWALLVVGSGFLIASSYLDLESWLYNFRIPSLRVIVICTFVVILIVVGALVQYSSIPKSLIELIKSQKSEIVESQKINVVGWDKIIEQDPNSAFAYFERGKAKYFLKDYGGAIEDYNKVIGLNPSFADVYTARGLAKIKLGQKDSGCLDLSKSKDLGYSFEYDLIYEFCR